MFESRVQEVLLDLNVSYYLLGKRVLALPNAAYILSNQHLSGVYELEAAPHFMECVHSFTVLVLSTVGV